MLQREYACKISRADEEITSFSFVVPPAVWINWGWRFWWRDGLFQLKVGWSVDVPVPERMARACRSFDLSRYPSELIHLTDAHAPTLLYSTNSCSRWAIRWLIITQSNRVILLVRMQATCEKNMLIRSPGEWLGVFQLNSPQLYGWTCK